MKALSILLILAGFLALTACDETQKPITKNLFVQQVESIQKAKKLKKHVKEDIERLLQEATEKRMNQIDGLK